MLDGPTGILGRHVLSRVVLLVHSLDLGAASASAIAAAMMKTTRNATSATVQLSATGPTGVNAQLNAAVEA